MTQFLHDAFAPFLSSTKRFVFAHQIILIHNRLPSATKTMVRLSSFPPCAISNMAQLIIFIATITIIYLNLAPFPLPSCHRTNATLIDIGMSKIKVHFRRTMRNKGSENFFSGLTRFYGQKNDYIIRERIRRNEMRKNNVVS